MFVLMCVWLLIGLLAWAFLPVFATVLLPVCAFTLGAMWGWLEAVRACP